MKIILSFVIAIAALSGCSFSSNGERIFFTAKSKNGQIAIKQGPPMFKNAVKGCSHCHGKDGRGGHSLDLTGTKGTDIRYETLALKYGGYLSYLEGKEEKISGGVGTLIKMAITNGKGAGHELSIAMPRWAMSENDLNDLLEYLKTL